MRYRPRHAGGRKKLLRRRMRLLEMVDLADMLRCMGELKADALAMSAGRKAPALDHRDLVRHVGMRGIMRNRVDAGLRDDLSGLEFLRHGWPPLQTYPRFVKRSSTRPGSRFNGFRRSRLAAKGKARRMHT